MEYNNFTRNILWRNYYFMALKAQIPTYLSQRETQEHFSRFCRSFLCYVLALKPKIFLIRVWNRNTEREREKMALEEAIVFQDLFSYNNSRDLYNLLGGNNWSSNFDLIQTEEKLNSLDIVENQAENFPYSSPVSQLVPHLEQWGCNSFIEPAIISPNGGQEFPPSETSTTMPCRPKRRRSRSKKNMEDIENQRMTHIAVERNRRKQMNEYLSLLRSLMPESYVQRVLLSLSPSKLYKYYGFRYFW